MKKDANTEMIFSCVGGYNSYIRSNINQDNLLHVLSNTEVRVQPIELIDEKELEEKWRFFIENPSDIKNVIWPIDVVRLKEKLGLVYRLRVFPKLTTFKELLYDTPIECEKLNWSRLEIRVLIKKMLMAFNRLHKDGYIYHSFLLDKMFYDERTQDVILDFSLAMGMHHNDNSYVEDVNASFVGIEFLPPWISINKRDRLALLDDYYSISAILFRLMVGRMPYQGENMVGYGDIMDKNRDNDENEHWHMFEHYYEKPVFIFDPDDKSNSIRTMAFDELFIERWNALPEKVQSMFIRTFSQKNIKEDYANKVLFSPQEWLDVFMDTRII